MKKPKYRLCWWCNKKFWGNHHTTVVAYGFERLVHKACRKKVLDDTHSAWQENHFPSGDEEE